MRQILVCSDDGGFRSVITETETILAVLKRENGLELIIRELSNRNVKIETTGII